MTRLVLTLTLLLLASAAHANESIRLELKTSDVLEGKLKLADDEGVKLDIGDGIELYIRWAFIRGDKHFDLRKSATDFNMIESVLKLADFCHDFAMDEQESHALAHALKLDPGHKEARQRLSALPPVAGLEVPGLPGEAEPPRPEPAEELPPPTRSPFVVMLDFVTEDAAALEWFKEELDKLGYKLGGKGNHEIRIRIDLSLKLERNPTFMGAELYAEYSGRLAWQLYRNGESVPFARDSESQDAMRRDNKDEARNACRKSLMQDVFPSMHREMEKLR